MEYTLCVPCLLGLEGLAADELRRLGFRSVRAENGRVYFAGGAREIASANICLRTGERVMVELGRFPAHSFAELFDGVAALPWEDVLTEDACFPVKGHCLDSKLFSVSDCQSIVKKAIVERLKRRYAVNWFSETGAKYAVNFMIMKDVASICIDTSGEPLHKRGYRPAHNAAPLRETLAAAMVTLSRYRGRGEFCDPFCGSGTIAIEAALAAKNRAPGIERTFTAMSWPQIPSEVWRSARDEARAREYSGDYRIFASDIDPKAVAIARENARRAGVDGIIRFDIADARGFDRSTERGVIVTNPPYGERVMDRAEAGRLYAEFGSAYRAVSGWELYLLSAHTEFERCFGRKADKKRKLYNGMLKCDLFMYRNERVKNEAPADS